MYSSEFRDAIYGDTPPRETKEHKENAINQLNKLLPEDMKWKHVLDYWCGSGHIWENLMERWACVDFAEISSKMVEKLRNKFEYIWNIWEILDAKWKSYARVFWVKSPKDLPVENWTYDCIIAWSVLHHINPDNWKEFLDRSSELLKIGWKMIITWRDESDAVLKQDWFKWHVTWQPSYTINNLPNFLDREKCEIVETWVYSEKLQAFKIPRMFRYYIVKKIDEKSKENRLAEIQNFYDENVPIRNINLGGSRPTVRKNFYKLLWNIKGKNILDIWCGTWIDSNFFSQNGATWIWIDISQKSVDVAKTHGSQNWNFLNENFMDFEEKWMFDIVVFSMGIMHYKCLYPIFEKISSFLKPGGKLLLTTNNPFLVCEDFSIEYPDDWEDIEYIHMLWENRDIPVTKFVHPISNYIYNANNVWLRISIFQKQSVYGPETSVFNNPNPKDPWVANFIAFLYEKIEKDSESLNGSKVENFISEIENFTISPSEKWNYSWEILSFQW